MCGANRDFLHIERDDFFIRAVSDAGRKPKQHVLSWQHPLIDRCLWIVPYKDDVPGSVGIEDFNDAVKLGVFHHDEYDVVLVVWLEFFYYWDMDGFPEQELVSYGKSVFPKGLGPFAACKQRYVLLCLEEVVC